MTDSPKFTNANGTLTRYAFGCGHVESYTLTGGEYFSTNLPGVALYQEGIYWRVSAHSEPFGHPENVGEYFDTLTEARQAFRKYKRMVKAGQSITA